MERIINLPVAVPSLLHCPIIFSWSRKVITVAAIAAGVQFGWALQLSLLTPYVQTMGVPHVWASFIWVCGPISGLLVQPLIGFYSNYYTSTWGRRRPFILVGAACVCIAVMLISFAKDIGHAAGDHVDKKTKPRAVVVFVTGFWLLDVANYMLQGPCRAFLADLSGGDYRRMGTANALFAGFMGLGNILGYIVGSLPELYKLFPFTVTGVCDENCTNLKACFIVHILLLTVVTVLAVVTVSEAPATRADLATAALPFFRGLVNALRSVTRPMWMLLLVTALNWVAWFSLLLNWADWMGSEVFGGKAVGTIVEQDIYGRGVHAGSIGLVLNSFVLMLASLAIGPVARLLGGVKRLWGIVNIILAVGLFLTLLITKQADEWRSAREIPPMCSAFVFFAVLGIPLAVTFSVPFALASTYCSEAGGGQGLSMGIVNIAIVMPQMFVSVVSGPVDTAFGGGNLPTLVMGGIAAMASAVVALFFLSNLSHKV